MGATGKQYQASKDFLKWNGFEVKEWISIVLQMGFIWVSSANEKSK